MAWTEAAMRRAGAFVALTTASALVLVLFPAPEDVDRGYVLVPILALFLALLLGCAAVLLSRAAARELRWAGFTAVVFCAGHVVRGVVREEPAADKVAAQAQAQDPPLLCLHADAAGEGRNAMACTEAAMRRAGAFVALAAASALVLLLFPAPAAVDRGYVLVPILALFVALPLGCAAVLLSPAAAAVARAILAVHWGAATARELRWAGLTAVVFCAGLVSQAVVREEPAVAKEEVSADKVGPVAVMFLVFLAGVWTVNLSVLTGKGEFSADAPARAAAAAADAGRRA